MIDRIYLRNYRVFEDELDLHLPPGLVGVYGPNGAGKSSLLESVLWALWGRARTPKEDIPSAGTHGECVAEITFEHEGHIYLVRRTIAGVNATVRAQAQCDGMTVTEGVRDTGRYVHSVLGMDDAAFRASVFAEQKQLAAFSAQGPADRRKLVLGLLGVSPLDGARDKARADAREATQQHSRLRGMLPDLQEATVTAADAEARAAAAEAVAAEEEAAATAAQRLAQTAREDFGRLDLVRQDHDKLVLEGKAARAEQEAAEQEVAALRSELGSLAEASSRLGELGPLAARFPELDRLAQLLAVATTAAREAGALEDVAAPDEPDQQAVEVAAQAAMAAQSSLGSAEAGRTAALDELRRAKAAHEGSAKLSGEEACPLCGQALGDAFAQVQAHRAADLQSAQERLREAEAELQQAVGQATAAQRALQGANSKAEAARQAHAAWEQARDRRAAAYERLSAALAALGAVDGSLAGTLGAVPGPAALAKAGEAVEHERAASRQAREESDRLRGRLDRRPVAEAALARAQERGTAAAALVASLRAAVKKLGFDQGALSVAYKALEEAEATARGADSAARAARLAAATAKAYAEGEAKRLDDARAQHARLADLESASVHLSRTAELLNGFRNSVVASVGPRLAVQAAELFAELTDNEYDRLEVDTDTYGLQISDGGISYDLERFSGSEVDLANLALRVAISEHVRFQSGGSVGLLVLDEVFGPLDEERTARMLIALERLRGRFRQILVVTHSTEIKGQLPNAIEVQKRPGRRARARLRD